MSAHQVHVQMVLTLESSLPVGLLNTNELHTLVKIAFHQWLTLQAVDLNLDGEIDLQFHTKESSHGPG